MLKNTILIIAALGLWTASSILTTFGIPGVAALSDALDVGGEALFAAGLLYIFIRQAVITHQRHGHATNSLNHQR